jgi:hypothetical protein
MSDRGSAAWQDLFVAGDASHPEAVIQFQIAARSGRPLLVLPADGKLAACALEFFAGRSPGHHASQNFLALALRFRLPAGLQRFSLAIEREEPFAAFLTKSADGRHFPRFAIQAQDADAQQGHFVLLVFNQNGSPVAIIKAGLGRAAADLIEDEAFLLESLPTATPGAPRLRGVLRGTRVEALAIDYVPGGPAGADDEAGVERLLTAWIDTARVVPLREMFSWQMLEGGSDPQAPGRAGWSGLRDTTCHPVLFNGAFAPWNIRAGAAGWMTLDWERGELAGVPGWDWFHFVIQTAVFARAESLPAMTARVEALLDSSLRGCGEDCRAGTRARHRLSRLRHRCAQTGEGIGATDGTEAATG